MTIAICAVVAKVTQKWKAIKDSQEEKENKADKKDIIEHRASCASDHDIDIDIFDALSHIDAQYPGNSHKSAPSTGYIAAIVGSLSDDTTIMQETDDAIFGNTP